MRSVSGMIRERRNNLKPTQDSVEKILSPQQLTALLRYERFSWRLWFIRSPLFQEPLPILYNVKTNQTGTLEPNGQLNTQTELKVRMDAKMDSGIEFTLRASKAPSPERLNDRRKRDAPVVNNTADFLSPHQLRALPQLDALGWKVHFVRTSLFQEPVVVLVSSGGDMYAVLEHDGEINLMPAVSLRKEAKDTANESVVLLTKSKSAWAGFE